MATRGKGATTAAGLGWEHQQVVAELLRNLRDGSPCWWCGRPMHRDKALNRDGRTLHGDHTIPRVIQRYGKADRLLHATCNEQRGDGSRDHLRPAINPESPFAVVGASSLGTLAMPWP